MTNITAINRLNDAKKALDLRDREKSNSLKSGKVAIVHCIDHGFCPSVLEM